VTELDLDVVTGAFGYTGRYITERLLAAGRRVRTLTGHPGRDDPFGGRVSVETFDFDREDRLTEHLRDVATLYNTYWVRFPRGRVTYDGAVANSTILFRAAKAAGVRRIVHISITNPSLDSPFAYFRGKARVEEALRSSEVGHAIIRPTVVFGAEDILINNIAYVLRRLPVFGIPGKGDYRVRPVAVEDVADLCAAAGAREADEVIDAVGPETFTFEELARSIGRAVHSRARIVRVPPPIASAAATAIGLVVRDVVVTREEIEGMMAGLVSTDGPATGARRLSDWLIENGERLGRTYASEVGRHYRAADRRR
jgi:uncharacterized protein YbjT (DUF2867 family)